jgi:predicted ArsR family transcriptional regulator
MKPTPGDRRFWSSTRGRIILLLRRESRTVNDLARELDLTDNAVRAHLTALERDGLVRPSGTRPSARKPTVTYTLSPDAERLFPKLYGPVLRGVLDVLAERLPAEERDEILRAVARRVAADHRSAVPANGSRDPVDRTVAVLREWGVMPEAEEQEGKPMVRCVDCPLAVAAVGHPEVCGLVAAMLTDLVGAEVRARCPASAAPRCLFEVGEAAGAGASY